MRQKLEPKQKVRNPATLAMRLDIKANGWDVIPSGNGKGVLEVGWKTMANSAADIARWSDPSSGMRNLPNTSVRVTGDLLVFDIDIKDEAVRDRVVAAFREKQPAWFAGALPRDSGAITIAYFGRVSEPVKMRRTHRYGGGNMVEVHGALSLRQMVVEGRHASFEVTGRMYHWHAGTPWNTRLDSLPVMDAAAIGGLIDLADQIMSEMLPRDAGSEPKTGGRKQYTLERDTLFIKSDGEQITCGDLAEELGPGDDVRGVLGDYEAWHASTSKTRDSAHLDPVGEFMIYAYDDSVQYRFADRAPPPHFELDSDTLAAIAGMEDSVRSEALPEGRRPRSPDISDIPRSPPRDDDGPGDADRRSCANAVAYMLTYLAYWGGALKGRGGVVSIDPDGEIQTPWTLASLRMRMANYCYVKVGANGGAKIVNPVDIWMAQADRISVAGVRMRPELTRPLFVEDSLQYINRYAPPDHPTVGGTIAPLEVRLQDLIPDPDECAWFVNWLACKVQNPHWRMIGVAMIAQQAGSGRGLLAEFLGRLFGQKYVAPLPYRQLTGGDGSRFTADYSDRLLVYVNEAKTADDTRYRQRHAASEALKDFIEPNHKIPARIEGKGVDAVYGPLAISTLVFTNNTDGLPIGEGDRRLAVITNGPQMTVAQRDAFLGWMASPANIGAAYRHLRDHVVEKDRGVFDPYMAPAFAGRDVMIDAGKTDIDRAYEAALEILREASQVYTLTQVATATLARLDRHGGDLDSMVRRHARIKGIRAFEKYDGHNWLVRFGEGKNGNNKEPIFVHTESRRRFWSMAETKDVRRELSLAEHAVARTLAERYPPLRVVEAETTDDDEPGD
jgi:hypothetical protein